MCKHWATKTTHPHTQTQSLLSVEKARLSDSIRLFFLTPLSGGTVRIKYTIILFNKGLPVWGVVRIKMGEGWLFFKGKGWIDRINKAELLCLSSGLSASPVDISVDLTASLTEHKISSKYQQQLSFSFYFFSLYLNQLSYSSITVNLFCLFYCKWFI